MELASRVDVCLLPNLGNFQSLLLWVLLQLHSLFPYLLRLQWWECYIFCYSPTGSLGSIHFIFVYLLSVVQIGSFLLFYLPVPQFFSSILLLNPDTDIFTLVIIYFSSNISFCFFFNLFCFCWGFNFLICLKHVCNCLLKHVYNGCFKIFVT